MFDFLGVPPAPPEKYSYLDGSIPKHLIVICHPHVTMSIHGEIRCENCFSQIVAAFYMAESLAHVHVGPVYVVRSCRMSYLHSILCHFSGSISGCTFVLASQYVCACKPVHDVASAHLHLAFHDIQGIQKEGRYLGGHTGHASHAAAQLIELLVM